MVQYDREVHVDFTCVKGDISRRFARIDFIIQMSGVVFALEVDEHAHFDPDYDCDLRRMFDVYSSLLESIKGKPMVWIRYNPDKFTKDGIKQDIPRKKRMEKILMFMTKFQSSGKPMEIVYMFYSVDENENPTIWSQPNFGADVLHICKSVI